MIPLAIIEPPTIRNGRLERADAHTPHPKAVTSRAYGIPSAIHSCLVGAPIADSSLTVWETEL
jgi:hypothetical protein